MLKIFISNIFKPLYKFLIGILLTLYGIFALIRDDFLNPKIAEMLRLGGIFKIIPWYFWIIAGLLILWICTVWNKSRDEFQNSIDPIQFILCDTEYTHSDKCTRIYLLIHNKSRTSLVEDCTLKARTSDMKELRKLAWSNSNPTTNKEYNPISISPGDSWRSDIVIAWADEDHAILQIFPFQENDRIIKKGRYEIFISAIGKFQGRYIEHSEIFTLLYNDGNLLELEPN